MILFCYLYFVYSDPILCEGGSVSNDVNELCFYPGSVIDSSRSVSCSGSCLDMLNSTNLVCSCSNHSISNVSNNNVPSLVDNNSLRTLYLERDEDVWNFLRNRGLMSSQVDFMPRDDYPYNDFTLYSDGSHISEDMIVAATANIPYPISSTNIDSVSSIVDNTVRGSTYNAVMQEHPALVLNNEITQRVITEEIVVPKEGMLDKIKLGFNLLGGQVNKIYVKYHSVGKRKFVWNIWEKNRSKYTSYQDFKKNFDPKMKVFKLIYKDIKVDLKSDIERLLRGDDQFELRLGNGNRNYIGR